MTGASNHSLQILQRRALSQAGEGLGHVCEPGSLSQDLGCRQKGVLRARRLAYACASQRVTARLGYALTVDAFQNRFLHFLFRYLSDARLSRLLILGLTCPLFIIAPDVRLSVPNKPTPTLVSACASPSFIFFT